MTIINEDEREGEGEKKITTSIVIKPSVWKYVQYSKTVLNKKISDILEEFILEDVKNNPEKYRLATDKVEGKTNVTPEK